MTKINVDDLTGAVKLFNETLEKFQLSHNDLQTKIDSLNQKIQKKNVELQKKINEAENIKNLQDSILENISSGVIVIDTHGNIILFNRAAEEITNISKDEALGKSYLEILCREENNKSALFTLTTGKESHHRQKIIEDKENNRKHVEFSTSIIKDSKNKILGVVEVINDISQVKKLQERITHVETLAALGEMAASVAHEIRNPLSGIGGFAGLLDRQLEKTDARREYIKPIIEGVNRLNNIVSNLLTYTRPQNLRVSQVNLNETILEILDFFEFSISTNVKKIKIEKKLSEINPQILIDTQLFQQTMINLLKNAYEAVEDKKGLIVIKTEISVPHEMNDILDDDEKEELIKMFSFVEISITDNGYGIEEEIVRKLFNPFFTTKDDGNGLGLAICKKIVQLHKGDIFVVSQKNEGTTFTVTLPLFEEYEDLNIPKRYYES